MSSPEKLLDDWWREKHRSTALVSRGIDGARLTSDGLGDTKSVVDNATEDGRRQNRRVELIKQ